MDIDPHMISENEMDGYSKIDQYNMQRIESISSDYSSIIRHIGEE